jgi:hypothetical protein
MSFWEWFRTKFHTHQWEVFKEMPVRIFDGNVIGDENRLQARGVRYVLRCKICGEMKYKDML